MKTILLLFYVISSSTFAAEPIELEKLIKGQDFKAECGCGVMNDKKETFVMSGMPEFAPAIVKFDGKVKELKFISSTEKNAPENPGALSLELMVPIRPNSKWILKFLYSVHQTSKDAKKMSMW